MDHRVLDLGVEDSRIADMTSPIPRSTVTLNTSEWTVIPAPPGLMRRPYGQISTREEIVLAVAAPHRTNQLPMYLTDEGWKELAPGEGLAIDQAES